MVKYESCILHQHPYVLFLSRALAFRSGFDLGAGAGSTHAGRDDLVALAFRIFDSTCSECKRALLDSRFLRQTGIDEVPALPPARLGRIVFKSGLASPLAFSFRDFAGSMRSTLLELSDVTRGHPAVSLGSNWPIHRNRKSLVLGLRRLARPQDRDFSAHVAPALGSLARLAHGRCRRQSGRRSGTRAISQSLISAQEFS